MILIKLEGWINKERSDALFVVSVSIGTTEPDDRGYKYFMPVIKQKFDDYDEAKKNLQFCKERFVSTEQETRVIEEVRYLTF